MYLGCKKSKGHFEKNIVSSNSFVLPFCLLLVGAMKGQMGTYHHHQQSSASLRHRSGEPTRTHGYCVSVRTLRFLHTLTRRLTRACAHNRTHTNTHWRKCTDINFKDVQPQPLHCQIRDKSCWCFSQPQSALLCTDRTGDVILYETTKPLVVVFFF